MELVSALAFVSVGQCVFNALAQGVLAVASNS